MTAIVAVMGLVTFVACNKDDDKKEEKQEQGGEQGGQEGQPAVDTYVDLGLPSGTKWKNQNEEGLLTYEAAKSQFGNNLPSKEQMEELINECQWTWDSTNKGYTVTGQNGKSIFLPAAGSITDNEKTGTGNHGMYWSSSVDLSESENSYYPVSCYVFSMLHFSVKTLRMLGLTVRPVCP